MQTSATDGQLATSSRHSAHAAGDNAGQQGMANGLAAGRQTRSLRSRDSRDTQQSHLGTAAAAAAAAAASSDGAAAGGSEEASPGGNRDGGASVQRHDQQHHQQVRGGRALRSRRGQVQQPDEAQLQSDDDAQLAQALQESMLSAPPVRRSRRNVHAAELHSGQHSGHQGRLDEAAGPSRAADQMSPSSSRETRAKQRAARAQHMHRHETSPQLADTHLTEAEGHFVRRSQRQQTRASSATAEASQRLLGAAQTTEAHMQRVALSQDSVDGSDAQARGATRHGSSGIKLTLRGSSSSPRQHHEVAADAVHNDDKASANDRRTTTGLRVSLRPRRR